MRGATWRVIESVSWRSRYILTGDRRSWCAHAWKNRHKARWRIHVAVWDAVFVTLGERDHCRRAAAYWARWGR